MINLTPFQTMSEQLKGEAEERLANAAQSCSFGISFLDDALKGIFKNDLILLAGRSGQGKSEIALHISLTNAMKGKRVFHLALEAEPKEIARRMLFKKMAKLFYANRFVSNQDQRPSYISWYAGEQEELLGPFHEKASKELENYTSLKIFYRGEDFGLKELEQIFMSIKGQADLLCLDHLHYLDLADENENRAHKEAVKLIRNLALTHGIPVLLVAHIRKADRRNPSPVPDLEDVHGSSDVFKIATKAIMIAPAKDQAVSQETKAFRFPTYFRIAKCRQDGSLGWFAGLTSFDISRGEYDEHYVLGEFAPDGGFVQITQKPFWAKGAK